MPFTLAHPAAVLPLKRYCPRFLSFSALVVGSIVPDAGYCFGRWKLDEFSHTFSGILGFSLPAGLLMLAVFYGTRRWAVEFLPANQRQLFRPLCQQPPPSIVVMAISVCIGALTHVLWDSFTHKHGWLVTNAALLQLPVMEIAHHQIQLCNVLWYLSSFGGVACLCFAYEKWREGAEIKAPRASRNRRLRNALLVGFVVIPIEAAHHLVRTSAAFAIVGACSLALVMIIAVGLINRLSAPRQKET